MKTVTALALKEQDDVPHSFLRLAKAWVLLPVVAWVASFPIVGMPASFAVPFVIYRVPAGLVWWWERLLRAPLPFDEGMFYLVCHLLFWWLLIIGAVCRKTWPVPRLKGVWFFLVLMLFLTLSGCVSEVGPAVRNPANWH